MPIFEIPQKVFGVVMLCSWEDNHKSGEPKTGYFNNRTYTVMSQYRLVFGCILAGQIQWMDCRYGSCCSHEKHLES